MMPKRDGIVGQSMIVWGVTTLPNTVAASTTTYRFNFGDGTAEVTGNVGATAPALERLYINVAHVFPKPGTFTVTMTITNQQQGTETATVEVRIIDPADLTGPGTKVSPVGPNSNEFYRKLRINMAIQDGLRFLWQSQNRRALDFNLATTSWSGFVVPHGVGGRRVREPRLPPEQRRPAPTGVMRISSRRRGPTL